MDKPLYSGKRIIKAGEELIDTDLMLSDKDKLTAAMDVLSYWRFSHANALNVAFNFLQTEVLKKDKNAIFARRLKRHVSIVKKLRRFDKMKLKNMQDIGGARAVVSNSKKLQQIIRELKKNPIFKNKNGKLKFKNYINSPKGDGYRSYHLVGQFTDTDKNIKSIEIQLRTQIQHYWATALEIVDLFTGQALKSNQGEDIWKIFFIHVSEQFSIMDEIHLFNTLPIELQESNYNKKLEKDSGRLLSCQIAQNHLVALNIFKKLDAFSNSLKIIDDKLSGVDLEGGYVLVKIEPLASTVISSFFSSEDSELAAQKYIEAEKEAVGNSKIAIALVSTSAVGDIKEAYPNYFADSTKFMEHLQLINSISFSEPATSHNYAFL